MSSKFAKDIASAFASLSERQERLGPEFEAAIFENLDDLYEPSDLAEACEPVDAPNQYMEGD